MVWGDAISKLETFVWIFHMNELIFKTKRLHLASLMHKFTFKFKFLRAVVFSHCNSGLA